MSDEQVAGYITIRISENIEVESNLSGAEINLWLDRVKDMIITGDIDEVEEVDPS